MNFSLLMNITSAISIFASATIWIPFFLYPSLKSKPYMAVVFYIALSDFINGIGSSIGLPPTSNTSCEFQGIVTNIFTLSSVFWTVVIAMMMYSIVVSGKILDISYYHHFVCWGGPVFLSLIPLIDTYYGTPDGQSWCWLIPHKHTSESAMLMWKWVSFYGFIWGCIFVIAIIFCLLYYEVHVRVHTASTKVVQRVFKKLQLYPFVIVISWLIPCVNDLYVASMPGIFRHPGQRDAWNSFSLGLPCLQGFFTTAVFWWSNPELVRTLYGFVVNGKSIGPSLLSRSGFSSKVCPEDNGVIGAAREVLHSMSTPVVNYIRSKSKISIKDGESSRASDTLQQGKISGSFQLQTSVQGSRSLSSNTMVTPGQATKKLSTRKNHSSKSCESDAKSEIISRNNSGSRSDVDEAGYFDMAVPVGSVVLSNGASSMPRATRLDRISEVSMSDHKSHSDKAASKLISRDRVLDELNAMEVECIDSPELPDDSATSSSLDLIAVSATHLPPITNQHLADRSHLGIISQAAIELHQDDHDTLGPLVRVQAITPDVRHLGPYALFTNNYNRIAAYEVNHSNPSEGPSKCSPSKDPMDDDVVEDIETGSQCPEAEDDEQQQRFGRLSSGYQFYR